MSTGRDNDREALGAKGTALADANEPGRLPSESSAEGSAIILLVDDEAMIREVAADMLGVLGFRARVAASGDEACAILAGGMRPDLVILDLAMPGMPGRQTFYELRKLCPGLPVLLASGYCAGDVVAELLAQSNARFIQKPYALDQLAAELRAMLGIRAATGR